MMEPANKKPAPTLSTSSAFRFVLTVGIVNLFADMTYEGASSINGPFLGLLGAGAAAIGVISGVGEFLDYSLRLFAGYVTDKTGKYWLVTFVGYAINLLAVPALALAGSWTRVRSSETAHDRSTILAGQICRARLRNACAKAGRGAKPSLITPSISYVRALIGTGSPMSVSPLYSEGI